MFPSDTKVAKIMPKYSLKELGQQVDEFFEITKVGCYSGISENQLATFSTNHGL